MSKLSVIIPAWNEQEAIAPVVERVLATADTLRQAARIAELEVLVVDDGSVDGTAAAVRRIEAGHGQGKKRVRLLQHEVNRGYGAALQTGFAAASGNLLAFLDADCTYPPEHLPALCRSLTPRTALVLGDRLRSRASQMPALRRLGNTLLALLVSVLTRRPVVDCCSGMRVMRRSTWRALGRLPDGLDYTPAMTMRALLDGLDVAQVVIPYHERLGRSKLKLFRDGVRFFHTILREARASEPLRFWARISLVATVPALALTAGAAVLSAAQRGQWAPWGFAALILAACTLVGWSLAEADAARPGPPWPALTPQAGRRRPAEEERWS